MKTTDTIKALRDALTRAVKILENLDTVRHIAAEFPTLDNARKVLALTADASEDAPDEQAKDVKTLVDNWMYAFDVHLGGPAYDALRDALAASPAPVGAVQAVEPYAYSYECRQPGTDGKVWAEFIHKFEGQIPVEDDGIRNIKWLHLSAAAPAAPIAEVDDRKFDMTDRITHGIRTQPIAEVTRTKLKTMQNDDGEIGWYFDCDGHYIDVERDKDGKYSVFFRNRSDRTEAWLDQAEHAKPEPVERERSPFVLGVKPSDWADQVAHAKMVEGASVINIRFERAVLDWNRAQPVPRIEIGFEYYVAAALWKLAIAGQQAGVVVECTLCNGMGMLDGSGATCPHCDGSGVERQAGAVDRAPSGYAYRYHDEIRFGTGGRSINGSYPIEAIPYWLGEPAPKLVGAVDGEAG